MQQTVWPLQSANIDPPTAELTRSSTSESRLGEVGKLAGHQRQPKQLAWPKSQNRALRQQGEAKCRSTEHLASGVSIGTTCCDGSFVGRNKQASCHKLGPDCQFSDSDEPRRHRHRQQQQTARDSPPSPFSGPSKNIIIISSRANKADNNDDSNDEGAFASSANQFNTCSINDNHHDYHDHESNQLFGVNSTHSDRHKHHHIRQISPSSSLLSSPSASSLLSYIEPKRRRASSSSITLALNNRLGDCALDRCCCSCFSSSQWQQQQQRYSSTMIIGSSGGSPQPNCAPTDNLLLLDAAGGGGGDVGQRNQYYNQASPLYNNNTNKTALFSRATTTKDAPPSSGGATTTTISTKFGQQVHDGNNSGKTTATTTTTTNRTTISKSGNSTSATDCSSSSSSLSSSSSQLLFNNTAAVDGYVWPSLFNSASPLLSGSSSLKRSRSCNDTVIYNLARRRRRLCYLQVNSENSKQANQNFFHSSKQTQSDKPNSHAKTTTPPSFDDLLAATNHHQEQNRSSSSISSQSDQSLDVIEERTISKNNYVVVDHHRQQQQQQQKQQQQTREPSANKAGKKSFQIFPGNAQSTSFGELMAILQQLSIQDRLEAPKTYPNNTLIVDLNKCHNNVANWWPQTTITATKSAIKSSNLASFWSLVLGSKQRVNSNDYERNDLQRRPSKTAKKSRYKFPMPDPISRTNVKLRPDDYNTALNVLTSDVRFKLHLLLYRRVQTIWMLLSTILCILVPVVLTNLESLMIAAACFVWLALQVIGAFAGAQFRSKLDLMLEKSVAQVNSFFLDHNLMLGVINVGSLITKTKLTIPILYFDTSQCREHIESIISIDSRRDACGKSKHILDYSKIDLPPTGPNSMALAQSQLAKKIVLRYSQRWISYFDKRKLMFNDDRAKPRHLSTGKCVCQFVEEHFKNSNNNNRGQSNDVTRSTDEIPVRNSYLSSRNEVSIVFAEHKQQHQRNYNQETLIKQKVIRNQQMAARMVPTLSSLVSLGEDQPPEHVKVDMNAVDLEQTPYLFDNNHTNGLSELKLWNLQQQQQPNDRLQPAKSNSPPSSFSIKNQSSPDVSLEMNSDSIGRSDELVRKLRLLLELRKNELQGLDGTLFSSILNKTPQPFVPFDGLMVGNNKHPVANGVSTSTNDSVDSTSTKDENLVKVNEGKKFCYQRDGLFFFGTNGAKKSSNQHHNSTANRNHALEIC